MSKKNETDRFFPALENMTVKTVRQYLARKQSIIIPVGVIEQHGYHLPLSTDALLATHLARRIGTRADILVAPTIHQSFSGGGCPGTVNLTPAVMSLVVSDTLVSLADQGFRNFFIFLSHGGSENARALDDALKLLLRSNPTFETCMIVLAPVWDFGDKTINFKAGFRGGDWHAGRIETSMVMAVAPEMVRMDELEVDAEPVYRSMIEHPDNYQHAEKIVDDPLVVPRLRQREEVKVGVMGFPEQASRELGIRIVDSIVADAAQRFAELEAKADGRYREVDFKPEPIIFDL